jgi:2-polyprenyl-6-methoxyphenol hydroxylase-like FAD-dependent oxidoreductase
VRRDGPARYQVGNVFFLGDAARAHGPFLSARLNAGIADAVNLGWKLALVVNDGVPPAILTTYRAEREPAARAGHSTFEIDERPSAHFGDALAGLHHAYPDSPLSVEDAPRGRGLRAGMRVRGHRPAGFRPQTVVLSDDNDNTLTIVLRPDGYAGYVATGTHAGGADVYLRNVIGLL